MTTLHQTLNVHATVDKHPDKTALHCIIPYDTIHMIVYGLESWVYLKGGAILTVDCDHEDGAKNISSNNQREILLLQRARSNDKAIRGYANLPVYR